MSEPGEPAAAALGRSVRERVPPVPGQADHADAELEEHVGEPGVEAERLGTLQGQDQPDPPVPADLGEIGRAAHGEDAIFVLAERPVERGDQAERAPQRALRLVLDVHEDRADLEADPARLELTEPPRSERILLGPPVGELEQQVVVRVDDQEGATSTAGAPRTTAAVSRACSSVVCTISFARAKLSIPVGTGPIALPSAYPAALRPIAR